MTVLIVSIILIAGVATILIGINPRDKQYATRTKRNMTTLTLFYVVSTVLFFGILFYLK